MLSFCAIQQIISALTTARAPTSLCEVADDVSCENSLSALQQIRLYELSGALQQRQPEFGLRLLLAIIYVARRQATEGQIWPAVQAGLNLSAAVAETLFLGNGQPRVDLKELIEKTCRHFHLRHIFGQEGTHSNSLSK